MVISAADSMAGRRERTLRQPPLGMAPLGMLPLLGALFGSLIVGGAAQALPNPYPAPYPNPYPAPYPAPYPQPSPQPMPGQTLLFPAPGVVCDQPAQLCYNSGGLSIGLTGRYFGSFARQNAQNSLNGGRPPQVFSLSNGSRCDGRRMTCWSSGYGQPVVNQQLTTQLYGSMPAPTPYPGPQPYPTPNPAGYSGLCQLMRSGATLYNGSCALNEVRQGFQPRFEVLLRNGNRYVFEKSPGGYLINDPSGGRWPVQVSDNGNSGVFRWADMSLAVTQNNYQPDSTPGQRWGRAIGNFLIDLFN
ncbi:MAG: YcgJ family protein [Cyanobacteriota bacterium]